MGIAAIMVDVAKYPLTIGLLGAIGIVMVAEYLTHLIHKLQAGIWSKFRYIFLFIFHIVF